MLCRFERSIENHNINSQCQTFMGEDFRKSHSSKSKLANVRFVPRS
uniref:Uncharacterized protein n=1 Tax=Anguilla anguilla TaxID=7936 RepID=A0A0E9WJR9_ANGAN